jgi:hypothetical protein
LLFAEGMEHTSLSAHAPARTGGRLRSILLPTLVALTALLPRVIGLADFLTTDEAHQWIRATEIFAYAISLGRWEDTNLIGHPGVTLMWLGALGLHLERLVVGLGWIAPPDHLGHLAWLRLGPVLANTLMITAGYLLLRRLIRPGAALVAALLWATSPFLVAQGRLLHLDALLSGFCMLALLCTLQACFAARPLPWLIAVGVLTGLALLTKGPALIVLPVLGLIMFTLAPEGLREGGSRRSLLRAFSWFVPRYLLVLVVAACTALLLWPALWVIPERAIGGYLGEIINNGGRPNGDGQFFLGRDDHDPGALFYPIAGLYRLTGFTVVQEGATLVVTPAWDVRTPPPADLLVFIHLYDHTGTRVAQVDVAPGGASLAPTSQWQPGAQIGVPLPMALPAELPPGTYTLTLGLYDPVSGVRVALSAGPRADPTLAGPEAALLGQVRLTR